MGTAEEKHVDAVEKVAEAVLKRSEKWTVGQKIVAASICLLGGAALITGIDSLRVAAGVSIALLGVAFLTFRKTALESQTLVLRDTSGRARVSMNAEGLVFLNPDEQPVLWLTADQKGSHVYLHRPGSQAAAIHLGLSESAAVASLGNLNGARITLTSANDGNLGIVFENAKNKPTALLGSIDDSAHLSFLAEDGETIASYPTPEAIKDYAQKLVARGKQA